jgi:hypothetical protein
MEPLQQHIYARAPTKMLAATNEVENFLHLRAKKYIGRHGADEGVHPAEAYFQCSSKTGWRPRHLQSRQLGRNSPGCLKRVLHQATARIFQTSPQADDLGRIRLEKSERAWCNDPCGNEGRLTRRKGT